MIECTCYYCGKIITVKPYRLRAGKVFCSIQCKNSHYGQTKKAERLTHICPECNQTFTTTKGNNAIYCSRSCNLAYIAKNGWESRIKKITTNCPNCGKEFSIPPCRLKYSKNICCSKKCRAEYMMGQNNPAFIHGHGRRIPYGKNWSSQRRKAIKRDNQTCQNCGKKTRKPRDLHVHHIVPAHNFNGDYESANHLSNLITLCIPCHEKAEKNNLTIQPKIL